MKKCTIFVIFILCVSLLCGCIEKRKNVQQDILNKIYEIDNDQYNTEQNFNHRNLISNKVEHFVESSMNAEKNVKIAGADYNIKYCEKSVL